MARHPPDGPRSLRSSPPPSRRRFWLVAGLLLAIAALFLFLARGDVWNLFGVGVPLLLFLLEFAWVLVGGRGGRDSAEEAGSGEAPARPGRRALFLAGAFLLAAGTAGAVLGAFLWLRGARFPMVFLLSLPAAALGAGVLALCWRNWGGAILLREAVRREEEPLGPPLGGESPVVRVLGVLVALALGAWALRITLDGGVDRQAGTLFLLGAVLLAATVAAHRRRSLQAPPHRARREADRGGLRAEGVAACIVGLAALGGAGWFHLRGVAGTEGKAVTLLLVGLLLAGVGAGVLLRGGHGKGRRGSP